MNRLHRTSPKIVPHKLPTYKLTYKPLSLYTNIEHTKIVGLKMQFRGVLSALNRLYTYLHTHTYTHTHTTTTPITVRTARKHLRPENRGGKSVDFRYPPPPILLTKVCAPFEEKMRRRRGRRRRRLQLNRRRFSFPFPVDAFQISNRAA